jgi:hypothetical protein
MINPKSDLRGYIHPAPLEKQIMNEQRVVIIMRLRLPLNEFPNVSAEQIQALRENIERALWPGAIMQGFDYKQEFGLELEPRVP